MKVLLVALMFLFSVDVYALGGIPLDSTYKPKHYEIFYHDEVSAESYMKLVGPLNKARRGDTVTVHFNSPGGSVHYTLIMVEAMKKTKAKVHGIVEAGCYSACAILLTYSDTISMGPYSEVLFHMPRTRYGYVILPNDPNPLYARVGKKAYSLLKLCCTTYLTRKEVAAMLKGKDIMIDGPLFEKRWRWSKMLKRR